MAPHSPVSVLHAASPSIRQPGLLTWEPRALRGRKWALRTGTAALPDSVRWEVDSALSWRNGVNEKGGEKLIAATFIDK